VTLEAAINAIWRRPTRSVLSGRLFALLILFVVGFLLLLTIGITSAQTAVSGIPGLSWLGTSWAVRLAGIAVAIAVSTVMFAVIYRFLPNGGAAWRPSILAGAVAAIAWELAKHGYAWYVGHLADYKSVYGPMGTLIGLVLWVYYSSFLLIYGSELARVCQDRTNAAGDSRRSVAGT
jgi:membrane protein